MTAVLLLLSFFVSGPSSSAFKIHIIRVERTKTGFHVYARSDKTTYRMHCDFDSEYCHMPTGGGDYMADNSKPKGNLVIYGVDEGSTVYIIDSEDEIRNPKTYFPK